MKIAIGIRDKLLKRHKLLKLTQEEIEHLNISITSNYITSTEKSPRPGDFVGEFFQMFTDTIIASQISAPPPPKYKSREYFPAHSVRPVLTRHRIKGITQKRTAIDQYLLEIQMQKSFNKILGN